MLPTAACNDRKVGGYRKMPVANTLKVCHCERSQSPCVHGDCFAACSGSQ